MACHFSKVNDICFPEGCSDLFATASDNDIRIWNIHTQQELLRVTVPNLHCRSVVFRKDGGALITGMVLPANFLFLKFL
jgi:WD40 repeat protein